MKQGFKGVAAAGVLAAFVWGMTGPLRPWTQNLFGGIFRPIHFSHSFLTPVLRPFFVRQENLQEVSRWLNEAEVQRQNLLHFKELELENERLRELSGIGRDLRAKNRKVIAAAVVGRDPSAWREVMILSKGSKSGVTPGMMVLHRTVLMGRVAEVMRDNAKVILAGHPRFRVGGLIQRTRHMGVVFGTPDGDTRIKYLPVDADIQPGDIVETAGLSLGTPKGIPIGKIRQVWKEPGRVYKIAEIDLFADIGRAEEVLCVSS